MVSTPAIRHPSHSRCLFDAAFQYANKPNASQDMVRLLENLPDLRNSLSSSRFQNGIVVDTHVRIIQMSRTAFAVMPYCCARRALSLLVRCAFVRKISIATSSVISLQRDGAASSSSCSSWAAAASCSPFCMSAFCAVDWCLVLVYGEKFSVSLKDKRW